MTALVLRDVAKTYGRTVVLDGVTLSIEPGERHAIIGPNGAGKSTLFNVVTGITPASAGDICLNSHPISGLPSHQIARLGMARSFQVTNIFPRMTVFENIRASLLHSRGYGRSFFKLLPRASKLTAEVEDLLESLGLAHRRAMPAGVLAYAEQRALEIGMTLAGDAQVVLLDEPTAGMSKAETAATVALIRRLTEGRTLVMVEHDMSVVFDLADRISVLVEGRILATGMPGEIRSNAAVQQAYLGAMETVS